MSAPPRDGDQALTSETAAALIRSSFPALDAVAPKYLGSGEDFDAFLTADGWVFRFPKRKESAAMFEPESRIHRLVTQMLPPHIRIPQVELLAAPTSQFPYPFAGHRYISGVSAEALDPALLPALARDIAAFLLALHSTPAPVAGSAGIHDMDPNDPGRREWLEHGIAAASRLQGLDSVVDDALAWLHATPAHIPSAGPLQLIHNDLAPEHLVVDPATGSLVGVLDWTDAILGDAARDFVSLVTWQGWRFTDDVLRGYARAMDREFRTRLRHMARLLSIIWLALAYEEGADLTKHVRGVHNAFAPDDAP